MMSNAAKGAWWMIAAAAALTAMAICIRYLPAYSVLLMIFLRNVINLFLMAPSLFRQGKAVFQTERLGTHALRNAFLYSGNVASSVSMRYRCCTFSLAHCCLRSRGAFLANALASSLTAPVGFARLITTASHPAEYRHFRSACGLYIPVYGHQRLSDGVSRPHV